MKINLLKISFALVALSMIAVGPNSLHAQDKEESVTMNQFGNRLVGAWETTIIPRNCDTGDQIGPPFQGVIAFQEGGTISEFAANPMTPYRTPGVGVWSRHGRDYSMKFSFIPQTPAGAPIGRMRVTQAVELNRWTDEMSSDGGFVLTNFSGVVLATGCSTSTAVRVEF